jgi:hypothetical protein
MGPIWNLSDRDIDLLLAGQATSGDDRLGKLARFVEDVRVRLAESDREVDARNIAAIVEAARVTVVGTMSESASSEPAQGRRRRLVIAFAVLAAAATIATAAVGAVRYFVLDKGFIGLPPIGATPSAPESGELVIQYRLDGRGWVYADGRLITLRSSGFLEQRLTPEGVELLRSEIVSTGLERYQPAPGPWIHNVIQVRIGDRLVGYHANFPERLRERLADPASWLPASAWANRQIRAYVAPRYSISYHAQPQTLDRSRILYLLPSTAEDMLRDKDAVAEYGQLGSPAFPPLLPITFYVSELTTEEARALAQALDDAGLKRDKGLGELGYSFEIPGTSVDPPRPEKGPVRNEVFIGFRPYLPNGEWICSECG